MGQETENINVGQSGEDESLIINVDPFGRRAVNVSLDIKQWVKEDDLVSIPISIQVPPTEKGFTLNFSYQTSSYLLLACYLGIEFGKIKSTIKPEENTLHLD